MRQTREIEDREEGRVYVGIGRNLKGLSLECKLRITTPRSLATSTEMLKEPRVKNIASPECLRISSNGGRNAKSDSHPETSDDALIPAPRGPDFGPEGNTMRILVLTEVGLGSEIRTIIASKFLFPTTSGESLNSTRNPILRNKLFALHSKKPLYLDNVLVPHL